MGSEGQGEAASTGARPPKPTGLRERKKERTKTELAAAALRLFAERGFDAVTVDDIAAAVDVSPRTFFRHFGSKEDVLLRDHGEQLARLVDELAERPGNESPLTAVRLAIIAVAKAYANSGEELFVRTRLMVDTPSLLGRSLELQQSWEQVIAEAVAARLSIAVDDDLRPRLVGACAVAALRVATDAWLAAGGHADLPELVDAALLLIAGGGDASRWVSADGLRPRPS